MTKTATTFVIIASALLVTCFGGAFYLYKKYAGPVIAETKIAMEHAQAFAPTTDNDGCVTEAASLYKTDNAVIGGTKQMMFLGICLKDSRPTPGFCDGVPPARDMEKTQPWQRERCGKIEAGNLRCPMLMGAIQAYCHQKG